MESSELFAHSFFATTPNINILHPILSLYIIYPIAIQEASKSPDPIQLECSTPPTDTHSPLPALHPALMGTTRHLRPLRVHLTASRLLESGRLRSEPPWYRVVGALPPTTTLVRPLPIPHAGTAHSKSARRTSNTFRPQEIVYPEDSLRRTFYKDHPWELARPRVVLENDGRDAERWDWSTGLKQKGRQVDGEAYV